MKHFLAMISILFSLQVSADVRLPAIFGSHMLVQRDVPFQLWGFADAGEAITATLGGQKVSATADASGKWKLSFAAISQSQRISLDISGKNRIQLDDILIGDVWICSGQSNMEWPVSASNDAKTEIAGANFPEIRLFTVRKATSASKLEDVQGEWSVCSPETVGTFSAVGYFFGRDIHKATGRPIGLIHTSWGGTPAEAWTDLSALKAQPRLQQMVEQYESQGAANRQTDFDTRIKAWAKVMTETIDPVNEGEANGFARSDFDDSQWKPMPVPGNWEATLKLEFDGVLWVRKEVTIPENWQGQDLRLELGAIDDWDNTYFNGVRVNGIGPDAGVSGWNIPRSYIVPKSLVKPGKNVIAIRIFDAGLPGGMMGPAEKMKISTASEASTSISLAGEWRYAIEKEMKAESIPPQPTPPRPELEPGQLYNAMIHPLIHFPIKGAIWYQGENNAPRAYQYRTLLPTMIRNWRDAWGEGEFPFLIVQLANFADDWTNPNASHAWAELREAQYLTAKDLPHCGLAVAVDIGEAKDIHPRDKQSVGHRLALQARKKVYGEEVEASGPEYKSMEVRENTIVLHFDHAAAGLKSRKDEPGAFAIAGEDRQFRWAKAKIVGATVAVWSDEVANPVAVRYAWGCNPIATLYNADDLPAIPFRTDDWPMSTEKND